jgi:hypothetical protein
VPPASIADCQQFLPNPEGPRYRTSATRTSENSSSRTFVNKGLEGEAQLALLGFCFAAYVLVRWTQVSARHLADRIFTAPAPHHVPGIVAS